MDRAINETDRRRKIQEEFNRVNSIQPKGIKKGIADIMEGARSIKGKNKSKRKLDKLKDIDFEPVENFNDPNKLKKEITRLEDSMYKYAGLDSANIENKILDTINSKVVVKKSN